MILTKLDKYEYKLNRYPNGRVWAIDILVDDVTSSDISDIATSLNGDTNSRVYVEGETYIVVDDKTIEDEEYKTRYRLYVKW